VHRGTVPGAVVPLVGTVLGGPFKVHSSVGGKGGEGADALPQWSAELKFIFTSSKVGPYLVTTVPLPTYCT
jgi:hypothetical protein